MHMSCFLTKLKQLIVMSVVALSGVMLWLLMMYHIFRTAA